MKNFLNKLRAAHIAFKDPILVREAMGIRMILHNCLSTNEFVLLYGRNLNGYVYPEVQKLTYQERQNIRRVLGL